MGCNKVHKRVWGGPVSHCQSLNNAPPEEARRHPPAPSLLSLFLPPLFLSPSPISRCVVPTGSTQSPRTLAGTQSPAGARPVEGAGPKEEGAERGGERPATRSLG